MESGTDFLGWGANLRNPWGYGLCSDIGLGRPRDTCSAMRSSCQTWALIPDARGQVPGQCDVLVAWPAEHILVFRPADERGLKAEFGYNSRRGFTPCDRRPPG